MKKIFSFLAIFCLSLSIVSAISIDNINQNPQRYKPAIASSTEALYIDTNTFKVIRYAPPFYIIEVDLENVTYNMSSILDMNMRFYYNIDDESYIAAKIVSVKQYNFDGTLEEDIGLLNRPREDFMYNENMYCVAGKVFRSCYKDQEAPQKLFLCSKRKF